MKSLIPHLLVALFWLSTLPSASAQNATLVVYNNTNATLDVYADQVHTSTTTSTVRVPPATRMTFTNFLPRGSVRVVAEAPFIRPRVNSVYVSYVVSGANPRTREWELFPSSFGMSSMANIPSTDVLPSPTPAPLPTPSAICRDLRPGETYYADFSRCCDVPGGGSRWTLRSDGIGYDYAADCRSYGIE